MAAARPQLPQVACFDTAFHHDLPAVASRFAIPRNLEIEGIRRYGFHGLSYEYISRKLEKIDTKLAAARVIVAHLGNGASLCAMQAGRSVDTTMGFTALEGLMMGTRCGAIDPGVLLYLLEQKGMTAGSLAHLLYNESGLLGISGISSDMRVLLESTDARAAEAIDLFCYRIARESGALATSLGGIDGLIFTAGIGENAPAIRSQICQRMAWLGVDLDEDANRLNRSVISSPGSRVVVRIVPTDEESMIAIHTLKLLKAL
jgi:acetate kinase